MGQSGLSPSSGTIAIAVVELPDGVYECAVTPSLAAWSGPTQRFHGQTAKHAVAIALERLASRLRTEAEAEQGIDWEAADRLPSGTVSNKRFHVILHYERIREEPSKFEALENTLLGNTVVENAEIAILQIDPGLPIEPWKKQPAES